MLTFILRIGLGVEFFVNFAEVGVGDMSINLSGADVTMAEHGLNGAQIGAVHQEVGGEGMTEGMGSDMLSDTGEASVFFNDAFDGTGSEATEIARSIGGLPVFAVIEKKGRERIRAGGEIIVDAIGGGRINKNHAIFLAFATNDKLATSEIDGITIKLDKLRNSETARKK